MSSVHLITNPFSGASKGAKRTEEARRLLVERGVTVYGVVPPNVASIRESIEATGVGVERMVVVGGDGLVHHTVDVAVALDVPLGVIASGTGNDFVRGVGLPTKLGPAVDAALGEPVSIDLIQVGDKLVASVVAMGFPTEVNARANQLRYPRSQLKYTLATMTEISSLSSIPMKLTVDGKQQNHRVSILAIANTEYFGGGMKVCPGANPRDSLMNLMVVSEISRTEMLTFLPRVFNGGHRSHRAVTMRTASEVLIEAPDHAQVWGDGEQICSGSVRIRVRPNALRLCGFTKRLRKQ